jgi:hypothetical protein
MSDEKPMGQVIQIDEGRIRDHLGEVEAGGKHAADPIGLVHCGEAFHGLDSLRRIRSARVSRQPASNWSRSVRRFSCSLSRSTARASCSFAAF